MALAQKQICRLVEQNRELRNKPTYLQSINPWQRRQENTMNKRQSLHQVVWESWTASWKSLKLELFHILYTKINSKWFTGLNIRQDIIKVLKGSISKIFTDINCSNIFSDQSPKAKETKGKINKWDLIKLKSWHNKGNHWPKSTYGIGESICQLCNQQGVNSQNIERAHTTQ